MIVGKSTSNRSSAASFSSTKAIHSSSTTIAKIVEVGSNENDSDAIEGPVHINAIVLIVHLI